MKAVTKNVCISLDDKTLEILGQAIERLRNEGNIFITRSALVRYAIQMQEKNNWADLPKTY